MTETSNSPRSGKIISKANAATIAVPPNLKDLSSFAQAFLFATRFFFKKNCHYFIKNLYSVT